MRCPVCETENGEDAADCSTCGHVLMQEGVLEADVELVPGLEGTSFDRVATLDVEALPGVEPTRLVEGDLPFVPDASVQVEHTALEADLDAPVFWSPGAVELETGRERDDGERTAAPQDTGACPWCGAPSTSAVCDNCGRRRSRYSTPPPPLARPAAASGETVMCPACFAKVPPGDRCVECGVPFPLREL